MAEFLDREAIRATLFFNNAITDEGNLLLSTYPAAPVVSREEFEMVEHERNAARYQLKLIGKKIGDSMDDVRIIRKGKWLFYNTGFGFSHKCSYCNFNVKERWIALYDFCPGCGADMRGEEDGVN